MKGPAKCTGYALASRANNETGECWPSVELLAEDTGYTTRTVDRALADLREAGLVESMLRGLKEGQGGRTSSVHRLTVPPDDGGVKRLYGA